MTKGAIFSKPNALRVLKATETVERQQQNLPSEGPLTRQRSHGFTARITGSDGTGRYNWEAVNFNVTADMTANGYSGDATNGVEYAVELHNSHDVLTGDMVELVGAKTYNVFQFSYSPGVQPATATTAISKRTGQTPGDGTVQVERYDSTSGDLVAGQSLKVYNSFDGTIDADKRVHITYGDGGLWWITAEDCSDSTT